jgi:hypothetical protein
MFRDYQQKRDIERAYAELNRQAVEIANIAFPSVFGFSEPDRYHAPEKDPA